MMSVKDFQLVQQFRESLATPDHPPMKELAPVYTPYHDRETPAEERKRDLQKKRSAAGKKRAEQARAAKAAPATAPAGAGKAKAKK